MPFIIGDVLLILRHITLTTFTTVLLQVCGCTVTKIEPAPLHPKVSSLLATNTVPIKLTPPDTTVHSAGHQYLLVAIPFGRIEFSDLSTTVTREAITQLALAGYTPALAEPHSVSPATPPPALTLTIDEVQLTAYDLLVTRRLFSSVRLTGVLTSSHGDVRSETSTIEDDAYHSFAFTRELTHLQAKTLHRAVEQLLRKLRITR